MKKHSYTAIISSMFILIFSSLQAEAEYKIERIGLPISHPWGMSQLSRIQLAGHSAIRGFVSD